MSLAHPLADEVQAALWSVQHLELNSSSFRATSHRTNVGLATDNWCMGEIERTFSSNILHQSVCCPYPSLSWYHDQWLSAKKSVFLLGSATQEPLGVFDHWRQLVRPGLLDVSFWWVFFSKSQEIKYSQDICHNFPHFVGIFGRLEVPFRWKRRSWRAWDGYEQIQGQVVYWYWKVIDVGFSWVQIDFPKWNLEQGLG